jgi:hypothetical protein
MEEKVPWSAGIYLVKLEGRDKLDALAIVDGEAPFLVIRQVLYPFESYRGIHDVGVGRVVEWGAMLVEKKEVGE